MNPYNRQFLRDKAAECRARARKARSDKERTLWLELAEEIAGRARAAPPSDAERHEEPARPH
jgi:hypothetical protein